MAQVPAWFDRKFEFNFPVEEFPNLCTRLRRTPARLEEMVRGVPHETMVQKHGDKWSAQEHAGHLYDVESLWLARVGDFLIDGDTLTAADLQNRKTDQANHNARPLRLILDEFRDARERLLDRVTQLDPQLLPNSKLHPRLRQPMRLIDHLYFVAEHDDHHLATIGEMIKTK
jgi:uncharacterized damage-inducible protein DinB